MRNPRTLDSHNPPTTHSSIEPLVTLAEVAEILGCSPQTIRKRRVVGGHPLFDKGFLPLGVQGGLRFLASDVREFIDNVATAQLHTMLGRQPKSTTTAGLPRPAVVLD